MNKKLVPLVLLVALGAAFFFWQKNAAAKNPALLTLYGNVDVREGRRRMPSGSNADPAHRCRS